MLVADQENLIPEIKEWRATNGPDFDIETWISIEGNIKQAIAFSTIFWPEFVEHDGCVLIKSHFSAENFRNWENCDNIHSYAQIEGVLNHVHIADLFSLEKMDDMNYEQIKYLGYVLRDMYETKLRAQFKDKTFIVSFNGEEMFEDLIDYQLTFCQEMNESRKLR